MLLISKKPQKVIKDKEVEDLIKIIRSSVVGNNNIRTLLDIVFSKIEKKRIINRLWLIILLYSDMTQLEISKKTKISIKTVNHFSQLIKNFKLNSNKLKSLEFKSIKFKHALKHIN